LDEGLALTMSGVLDGQPVAGHVVVGDDGNDVSLTGELEGRDLALDGKRSEPVELPAGEGVGLGRPEGGEHHRCPDRERSRPSRALADLGVGGDEVLALAQTALLGAAVGEVQHHPGRDRLADLEGDEVDLGRVERDAVAHLDPGVVAAAGPVVQVDEVGDLGVGVGRGGRHRQGAGAGDGRSVGGRLGQPLAGLAFVGGPVDIERRGAGGFDPHHDRSTLLA
jgi:hypothetical protein